MTSHSDRLDTTRPQHLLGRLEDEAEATGWVWDARLSTLIDQFIVVIERASC